MLPENLSTLRVVDLKEELSKRKLPVKGKKDELIARLQQSLDDEKQKEGAVEEPPKETSAQVDNASKETTTEENQPHPSDEKAAPTEEAIQHNEPVQEVTTDDKNTADTTTSTMPKEEKTLEDDDRGTKRKRSVDEKEEVKGESTRDTCVDDNMINVIIVQSHNLKSAPNQMLVYVVSLLHDINCQLILCMIDQAS